jgi:hypothetical protein
MTPEELDGTIKNAVIAPIYGRDQMRASGNLYGDRKGRFSDGEWIHTSAIVSGPDEHGIVRTRNSVYRIELAESPRP